MTPLMRSLFVSAYFLLVTLRASVLADDIPSIRSAAASDGVTINRHLVDYPSRKKYWENRVERKFFNGLEFFVGGNERLNEIPIPKRPSYLRTDGRDIVFFLFHGCSHVGQHWFLLPEELKFLEELRRRGITPVSVTTPLSKEEGYCWPEDDESVSKIARAMTMFVHRGHYLRNATAAADSNVDKQADRTVMKQDPLVLCAGGSSGGSLVANIAKLEPTICRGLGIYISPTSIPSYTVREVPGLSQIPTTFIYMPRDTTWASDRNIKMIASAFEYQQLVPISPRGVDLNEADVGVLAGIRSNQYLTSGNTHMTSDQLGKLAKIGLLDASSGSLLQDPRQVDWAEALNLKEDSIETMAIGELLNACYAQHEFVGVYAKQVVDYLLQRNGIATR